MKRLLMPEIITKKYRIPAGWVLLVPDFSASQDYADALTGVLMPRYAYNRDKASTEARERIDDLGRSAFVRQLRLFMIRCADDYARRFPDLVKADRTLRGFDASLMSKAFVPFRRTAGRNPHPEIFRILSGMAQDARKQAA